MKRNNKQIILYLLPQRTPLQMVLILTIYVVTLKKKNTACYCFPDKLCASYQEALFFFSDL